MDASEAAQVLIAGGGIAGLAVRRALALRRIPSLTLERRGAPEDGGLAINLPGNAVQALAQFGLTEALRSVGTPVRRREHRTERDRLLFAVDEAAFWGEAMADCLAGRTEWSGIGADYEARRRPRVAHVQAMTDRMSRSGRLPGWARRLLLPVIGPRSDRATYGPLREPVIP